MTPTSDPFDFSSPSGPASTGAPVAPGGSGWLPERPSSSRADAGQAGPPIVWLGAAALCGVAALLLALLLGGSLVFGIVAWVLGGPVGIGLLAWFSVADTRLRARAFYSSPGSTRVLYAVALVVVLVGVLAAALRIALVVGRL